MIARLVSMELDLDYATNWTDGKKLVDSRDYRLYVIDGRFPEEQGGREKMLGPNFVRYLRGTKGGNVEVLLFSADDTVKEIAQEEGIPFLDKKEAGIEGLVAYYNGLQEKEA